MSDRFTLVYLEDPNQYYSNTTAAYDSITDMVAPALEQNDVDDLNAGRDSVTDWEWDFAYEWKIIKPGAVSEQVSYSFPDWLIESVQTYWDSAVDRPKDFGDLPADMQRAVLGTVSRFRDGMSPTAG